MIPKFWDLAFCKNDPDPTLSHGISLYCILVVSFSSLLCWDLAKSPLFVRLSNSLSNTFSELLVSDSQKLETVFLSVAVCVFVWFGKTVVATSAASMLPLDLHCVGDAKGSKLVYFNFIEIL